MSLRAWARTWRRARVRSSAGPSSASAAAPPVPPAAARPGHGNKKGIQLEGQNPHLNDQTMKSRSSKIMGGMWKRNLIANSVSVDLSGDRANVSTQPQSCIQCLCIGVFWIIMHKFTHIHRPSSPQGIGLQCPMPTNEARSNSARVADPPWPAKSPGRSITGGKERNRNGLKIAIFKQNPDQISIPHRRTHT